MEDLCNIYLNAVRDRNMKGSFNAVAPEHITNGEFTRKIAGSLKRPYWLPNIPSFLIRLIFGEMSAMLLNGSRVSSKKLEATGYKFCFPTLDGALQDLFT